MSFLRHGGIYRSDGIAKADKPEVGRRLPLVGPEPQLEGRRREGTARALLIVRDEFRPAIPRSGCSPAEPVSASPANRVCHEPAAAREQISLSGEVSRVYVSHAKGAVRLNLLGRLRTPRTRVSGPAEVAA